MSNIQEIFAHPWFSDIDFDLLLNYEITPPLQPDINNANIQDSLEVKDYYDVNEKPKQFYLPIPADFFDVLYF